MLLLILLVCAGVTRHTQAATLTVETDGSGDYMIIQDALDAAALGDSILIGPGRFDTFRPAKSVVDGTDIASIAWVTTTNLTVVGAGRDLTVLGPSTPTEMSDGLYTNSLYIDGGASTTVKGLHFENTSVIVTIREQSILEDCRITRVPLISSFGVGLVGVQGVEIRGTEFIGPDAILTGSGTSDLLVEDCTFDDATLNGQAVVIGNGAQDCMIRRCTFTRGGASIQFGLGGTGWVEDCTFENVRVGAIDLSQGSAVVRRCHISGTRMGLAASSGRLEVYDTVVEGCTQGTLIAWSDVLIRNSHLLHGSAPTVLGWASVGETIDLRYNWWGTTDTTQIQSWIDDREGTVLWSPIADAPLPSEEESMSEIKAKYGRP